MVSIIIILIEIWVIFAVILTWIGQWRESVMVLALDLQDFLLRARVLKLYRHAMRIAGRAPQNSRGETLGQYTLQSMRHFSCSSQFCVSIYLLFCLGSSLPSHPKYTKYVKGVWDRRRNRLISLDLPHGSWKLESLGIPSWLSQLVYLGTRRTMLLGAGPLLDTICDGV